MNKLQYKYISLEVTPTMHTLKRDEEAIEFAIGPQSEGAKLRDTLLKEKFASGFLDDILEGIEREGLHGELSNEDRQLLSSIVDAVDSNKGRGLIGLTSLQLAIKAICPEQCIRLHKGHPGNNGFAWVEGVAMRSLDKDYNVPFLRSNNLCMLNADGSFMTRTLAENYPYTKVYQAEIQGPKKEWLELVERIEDGETNPTTALEYFYSLLMNKSNEFQRLCEAAQIVVDSLKQVSMEQAERAIKQLLNETNHSARVFEIAIHSFMQALQDKGYAKVELERLSQMRSANKKHGNVGDIELKDGDDIREAWDAKFGKPLLIEELSELEEKLATSPRVITAGFVTDGAPTENDEVKRRIKRIEEACDTDIKVLSLHKWIEYQITINHVEDEDELAKAWVTAFMETMMRKRTDRAPVDEPCDRWVKDATKIMRRHFN